MENIELFTRACKEYGLNDAEIFQTVDLWDGQNLHQVCVCIHAIGRKAQKNGHKGLGPKEAERNVRQFSEEQLKQGSKVINLQYGSNKHANQSGINFGNTRHM
ncbi:calponin transgelin [Brachionus plicatilis]|uniref:Calponin transgelin n=1 Tax=Brachionus plicatilis TaxID=10195 RepID=A0A3M7SXW0_BRAPC|nr:calponin transgelin [Brachionus plicatilis]